MPNLLFKAGIDRRLKYDTDIHMQRGQTYYNVDPKHRPEYCGARPTAMAVGRLEHSRFYLDWSLHQFGKEAAPQIAALLADKDMEYYIKAVSRNGSDMYFPPTAPEINQTLVVSPVL